MAGGLITALIGVIAKQFGPNVGGLFLAFPSIFPAAATLVEKHEESKKKRIGLNGEARARQAAALDASGAAIGSLGLLAFALIVWRTLPNLSPWVVLAGATLGWLAVSVLLWWVRKRFQRVKHPCRTQGKS